MDINNKLERLKKRAAERSSGETGRNGSEESPPDSAQGKNDCEDRDHYLEHRKLNQNYQHGRFSLDDLPAEFACDSDFLFRRQESVSRERLLLLDTETTGLAGGTGTSAFLVGLGYFQNGTLIVEQHLMRDFVEEASLLQEVKAKMESRPVPVTFNGKSFDLPLLKNRFILNRIDPPGPESHLDLLHPCRRLWKHHNSCSLTALEKNLLDFHREGDIDGSEVPHYYRAFLERGSWKLLEPILLHNRYDVISMAFLALILERAAEAEGNYRHNAREYYNLAYQLEECGRRQQSIESYERALAEVGGRRLKTEIEKELSWQYKRVDRYEEAADIWQRMSDEGRGGLFPYRELAKYYEHQRRDYARALKFCRRARDYLREYRQIMSDWRKRREELVYRHERLEEKLASQDK